MKQTLKYPDGHLLFRNLSREFPVITHGKGLYLFDKTGKRYCDATGGAFVASVGHGNVEIVDHITRQLLKVGYLNGTQFTSESAQKLAYGLCSVSPTLGLDRCTFLSSGSEAVEAAVKFARQLWVERGEPKRYKLIARTPGYHGNTLYALSASGRPYYKKFYGPLLHEIVMIPSTYEYRSPVRDYAKDGAHYYAQLLEDAILKEGHDSIAAFIVEPIIGSSAGGSLPPPGYFDEVQKICKKYGILMIADEVLCGSGRTGRFFASDHYGLKPDLLTLGKGINGGYSALSVLMMKDEYVQEIKAGSGNFMHAQTFMQAPCTTEAGVAILDYFKKHRVVENCEKVGKFFEKTLKLKLQDHPHVGFITGKGLLYGIEFVEDRKSKKPFDRTKKITEKLSTYALEQGLVVWPNVGQADGINGDLIALAPPLNITEKEADEIVELTTKVIHSFFKTI